MRRTTSSTWPARCTSATSERVRVRRAQGGSRLVQTARFLPRGLLGLAYWYAVLPLHAIVFRGMLQGIRRAAEQTAERAGTASAAEPTR